MIDIAVKVFELYVEKNTVKIGLRVRGEYDPTVRKPVITAVFDDGSEKRRLPLLIQAYYPSEDLKRFDIFAGYGYRITKLFFGTAYPKEVKISFEIRYGEKEVQVIEMEEATDLLVYNSETYEVEISKDKTFLVLRRLFEEEEVKLSSKFLRFIRLTVGFTWKLVLLSLSILLLPFFMVEAFLNVLHCVKRAPKNSKTGVMKVLFHVKWRVSGIIRKNLSFGYLRLNIARFGFHLFKQFKVKKNRIVFLSNRRDTVSGNYEFIYDKLIADKTLDVRTVLDQKEGYLTCFKYGYYMATAKVILIDDYVELLYKIPRREGNYLIQVWHACGAFKTFGFSRLGKPGGQTQKSNAHRNYDFCTVSSSEICKFYAEGFGLSPEKVVPTGVPRTDMFFDEEHKRKSRELFYTKYPKLKNKKVILFAPTFRGNGKKSGFYPETRFDFLKLYEHFKGEYAIIIKHHPFVNNRSEIPVEYENKIIDMSEHEELNELLFITDLLITDYSSVVFEASLLDIPMLFYSFDLQNYISTRGFYYEYDSFVPGKIVFNMEALIRAIETEDFETKKIDAFKHKFFDELDGKAGLRVANLIRDLLEK